jgi:hypothetical protein
VQLYHPKFFNEHEEVIIFTREEFRRMYQSMAMQIDHITWLDMSLDRSEEWNLIGVWPKIMERIRLLDLNLESIFSNKPLQTYLDTYIYDTADLTEMVVESSSDMVTAESLGFSWSK